MTTKEKIEVMQAYLDGKKIQRKSITSQNWLDWVSNEEPGWDWIDVDYRIKPEPTYRPYKDTDEMIADFKKRFNVEVPSYSMPEIWVKNKGTKVRGFVFEFGFQRVRISGGLLDMEHLFNTFVYLDGSPCGIVE